MPSFCACGCSQQVAYKGNYRKNHQPEGLSRDPEGKQKRANDINNPIWNPVNNPVNNAKWNPIWNPVNNAKWNAIRKQKRLDADIE